jgi:hypothetical protein
MLNEWSDREPEGPPRPLLLRAASWLIALTALGHAAVLIRLAAWLLP